jgi:predicted transcriptional regulator
MGQQEIYECIKGKGDWVNQSELSKMMGITKSSVNSNVNRLLKHGEIAMRVDRIPGVSRSVSYFKVL